MKKSEKILIWVLVVLIVAMASVLVFNRNGTDKKRFFMGQHSDKNQFPILESKVKYSPIPNPEEKTVPAKNPVQVKKELGVEVLSLAVSARDEHQRLYWIVKTKKGTKRLSMNVYKVFSDPIGKRAFLLEQEKTISLPEGFRVQGPSEAFLYFNINSSDCPTMMDNIIGGAFDSSNFYTKEEWELMEEEKKIKAKEELKTESESMPAIPRHRKVEKKNEKAKDGLPSLFGEK